MKQEKLQIRRPATILDKNSPISTDSFEKDTFVAYQGKVAVGGSRINHEDAALKNRLFYPETQDDIKLQVDDGGVIFDDGKKLVIPPYITSGTRPKRLYEAIINEESPDLRAVIDEEKKKLEGIQVN
jgi:hypothetical protein